MTHDHLRIAPGRRFLRSGRHSGRSRATLCLALAATLGWLQPASAAPDISWAVPENITLNQGAIFAHQTMLTAYSGNGTAWVFYRERAVSGPITKAEALVHAYRLPGASQWENLVKSGVPGTSQPLVCDLGGGPQFAALADGRALLVYSVHAGTFIPSGGCNLAGIQVLLLDPNQANPVETFFRGGGSNACPEGRNPRISTLGNTALIVWRCLPTNTSPERDQYIESAYFDGVGWTEPLLVPEANHINALTASPPGRFHTLGRYTTSSPAVSRYVSHVFDPGSRTWGAQAETVSDNPGPVLSALAVLGGDEGGVLAGFLPAGGFQIQTRYRDPGGTWGEPVQLSLASSISGSQLRLGNAGGRYAAVWRFGLPSGGDLDALNAGIAGAIRRADGTWTTPVDLLDERFSGFQPGNGGVISLPNGSFTGYWGIPSATNQNVAPFLRTATAPAGSNCWRPPVVTAQNFGTYTGADFTAGPAGDFVAGWIDSTETEDPATLIKAVVAAGPDGTGGSDDCEAPLVVDTTPDPFSFTAVTGAEAATQVSSNAITVQGINSQVPISIAGGEYSINGGGFTGAAGTVGNGDTVVVRLVSANSAATARSATVTIGGVSGSFSVTTAEAEPEDEQSGSGGSSSADLLMLFLLALIATTRAPRFGSGFGNGRRPWGRTAGR